MKRLTCLSFLFLSLLTVMALFPSLGSAYDITGTVSYTGSKTGRIYLTLISGEGHLGTSVAAPGFFTIRGVRSGSYMLQAYMDTTNSGVRLVTSPHSLPVPVNVDNANPNALSVTLADPPPVSTVPPPAGVNVRPGDDVAFVNWEGNDTGSGGQAESFNLYWSSSPQVSPSNYTGSKTNIPYASATDNSVMLFGLGNGSQLYFVSTAKIGTLESQPSAVIGPVTIGNPAGSYAVSGSVSFPTVANTVPLYLALMVDNKNPSTSGHLLRYAGPLTSPLSFSIPGVANGNYRLYAVLDNNNNGLIDTGDYIASDTEAPFVTVNGAAVANVSVTLTNKAANADVHTSHWKHGSEQGYILNFEIYPRSKRPVSVTLTSGPNVTGPIDVGKSYDDTEFYSWVDLGGTVPAINDTYTFSLLNSDGSTGTITGKVTDVLNAFAIPTAPVGAVNYTATPTFTWSAPSMPPSGYSYRIQMDRETGGLMMIWHSDDIPSSQTSALFNFDGRASTPALAAASAYHWNIIVRDPLGNDTWNQVSFAFPGTTLSITTSALSPATQSLPYSQQINTQGGTLPFSWSIIGGALPQGVNLDPTTGLLSGTPTVSGLFPFTVQVTDASVPVQTASRDFNLLVQQPQSLQITTASLPNGIKGVGYSQQIAVSGGVSPYSFTFTGTLPDGLVLDGTTGQISGTPTASGSFDFTIQVTDSASATASKAFTLSIADQIVTMTFGGVYHLTRPDGSQWDALDLGTNLVATTKGALSATVSGPGGFSYAFSDADIIPYQNGQLVFNKQYPASTPLPLGVYTFTLNDGQGHVSNRVDAHANPQALPLVDSSTIKLQRKGDGSYRVRWAPVNDSRTYSYRARIQTPAGVPVYLGPRTLDSQDDIPAGRLTDGTAYQVRIETQDSTSPVYDGNQNLFLASYDLMFNRSNSAFVSFTPQPADYAANRLLLRYANASTQVEADGSQAVVLSFSTNSATDTAVMSSASVSGPGNFSYTFDLTADKQANGIRFQKSFPAGTLTAGLYTFHVTANGLDHLLHATLTAPVTYPSPDSVTYQAEDLGNGSIRFSWADVNYTGVVYYRALIQNNATSLSVMTSRQNQSFVDLPKNNLASLGNLADLKWRVEVFDSLTGNTQRNSRNGPWSAVGVLSGLPPFDAGRPVINGFGVTSERFSNGTKIMSSIWLGGMDSDGTITELRVDGSNGYTRNLLTQGVKDGGLYRLFENGLPAAGLYTFTVKDNAGKTAVRYGYQPAVHNVPVVDFKSVRLSSEPNGSLRISWAPVSSDVPLWYSVFLLTPTDNDANGFVDGMPPPSDDFNSPINKTSVLIPAGAIPTGAWLIRIKAQDGGNFTTFNNLSRSVTFKSEGAGFNYATLSDSDGDGFASNIDTNDNDAAVYPLSPPVVVSTVPAANANGVAVNTTVSLTFNQPISDKPFDFEMKSSSGVVPGAGSYNAVTKTITFTPLAPLANGTLYSVTIGGVESMTGGKMSVPFTFSFTTVAADTTPPTVTAFTIPATSNSLTVPVNSLTATDDIGVAGYLLSENKTKPLPTDAKWSANKPANYTFASAGAKILYAFAKDAAGNVSNGLAAETSIKTDAPVVTAVAIKTVKPAPPWSPTSKTIAGSTALLLKVTCTGKAVSYQYAIDGGLPSAASKKNVLTVPGNIMSEGTHSIVVMASNVAGNTGEFQPLTVIVDNTPPTAVVTGQPQGLNMAVKKTQIAVSGEGVAFYRYKLRFTPAGSSLAGVWGKFSKDTLAGKPIAIAAKKSGLYEVAVIGKDAAGNLQSEASATVVTWMVDSVAPKGVLTTINGLARPVPAVNPVTLGLSYSGDPTEMSFSVDGVNWSVWEPAAASKVFTVPGTAGKKKIMARFRDEAGNISKVSKKPFTLL